MGFLGGREVKAPGGFRGSLWSLIFRLPFLGGNFLAKGTRTFFS
jgi:hypothetical protein